MKIEDKTDESSAQGFMFGLVILGPAAGKLKYTLLDKQDITLLQNHLLEVGIMYNWTFEQHIFMEICLKLYTCVNHLDLKLKAYVEIDRNGQGAQVFAFAYDVKKGKESGRYVHEILWEKYYGGIAPGFKVVHKNGITVDNRVENLMLCPKNISHYQCAGQKNPEDSLYWAAVVEMPHEAEPLYMKLFTAQEELSLMRYFSTMAMRRKLKQSIFDQHDLNPIDSFLLDLEHRWCFILYHFLRKTFTQQKVKFEETF
ncbi:unnamed protein product [Larinioides sclopetarius]|uniref:HNH nuclease domain-containing protein n=1 Tax=Larinioides sclopetarius TaxID=280406 RepID=A0AAV2BLY4_9ARAC